MKLNLDFGFNKIVDSVNVAIYLQCKPDLVQDLETFPYLFEENTIDHILFHHSLEHLGQKPIIF